MKPIMITTGEPAGIGMDIVIDVLCHHRHILPRTTYVTACHKSLGERLAQLGIQMDLPIIGDDKDSNKDGVFVIDTPCNDNVFSGKLNPHNASMVAHQLKTAHEWAMSKKVAAIITGPISKSVMIDGGIHLDNGDKFSGHTEFFMHKANCNKVVMMLANNKMKVALVTTHLPLKDVPNAITFDEVVSTVQIVHRELHEKFGIDKPHILVCGLNPHAGEDGHLGTEEQHIINPALMQCQNDGVHVSLAMPADTIFTPHHLSRADAIIAMYHDQGLAPLKSHGFGDTVNITLGLPYIRTSVDHGTALDLAGTGKASSSSLVQAIKTATFVP